MSDDKGERPRVPYLTVELADGDIAVDDPGPESEYVTVTAPVRALHFATSGHVAKAGDERAYWAVLSPPIPPHGQRELRARAHARAPTERREGHHTRAHTHTHAHTGDGAGERGITGARARRVRAACAR